MQPLVAPAIIKNSNIADGPTPASLPQLCVCMFLGLLCTAFVPETKGKTLEQIEANFH